MAFVPSRASVRRRDDHGFEDSGGTRGRDPTAEIVIGRHGDLRVAQLIGRSPS
jgi:hypothetical protein